MLDIEPFLNEIDISRSIRARELSEIKRMFHPSGESDPSNIGSKAVVVLTYAIWEGFYNDCVRIYVRFLKAKAGRVRDSDWMLLLAAFVSDFESLRAKNHSHDARRDFIANMRNWLDCSFDAVDSGVIEARSNLNFSRLSQHFEILNIDLTPFQKFRIRIDRELVGWRHSVAHGDPPDLSALDTAAHVEFAGNLLITIADRFQEAILVRA